MSGPASTAMMMSPHRDVLEANPDTDESKTRLVEELQSRGRAAVGAKSWMDAKLLYEKALTIDGCAAIDGNKKAVLSSNLSLVEKNMGQLEEARKAGERATREDPNYVKGWWRLGQALIGLHRSQEALEALSRAKDLEPTNKALVKELDNIQQQVDDEAALIAMDVDSGDESAATNPTTTTPSPAPAPTTTATKADATTKPSSNSSADGKSDTILETVNDDDDTKLFKKSEPIRGYKVVNGKKTSYFHNELDEKSKALIGDIAPKKLENPPPLPSVAAGDGGSKTSAWNQAGTWEEKDVTQWAKDTLTKCVLSTSYTLPASSPAPNALVTVTKVSTLDGHASVAVVRGKIRLIYEFCLKLDWQLDKQDDVLDCKGSLAVPDIDGTIAIGEGYEIHEFKIDSVSDNSVTPMVDRFVQRGGFQEALNESIDDWVRLFKKEYGGDAKA